MSSRGAPGPRRGVKIKQRADNNGARLIKLQMVRQKSRENDGRRMDSESNQRRGEVQADENVSDRGPDRRRGRK